MELFGSGLLWATPLSDAAGSAVAAPTPYLFGTLQDVDIDIKFELKKLHGQNQFPVAVGRGKGSVTCKAKAASIFGGMLDGVVFGQGGTNGLLSVNYDTAGAAIPATPFTITVAPPGGATFDADLGVFDAATGRPMLRVASAPIARQYSVNTTTGAYLFAAADTGKTVYINYRYATTNAVARRGSVVNRPMGAAPSFRCDLYVPFEGEQLVLTLFKCVSDGLKLSTKNDDFVIPEFGFEAVADVAGKVFDWATAE